MDLGIAGKVALVTGGAVRLGRAVTLGLAEAGYDAREVHLYDTLSVPLPADVGSMLAGGRIDRDALRIVHEAEELVRLGGGAVAPFQVADRAVPVAGGVVGHEVGPEAEAVEWAGYVDSWRA